MRQGSLCLLGYGFTAREIARQMAAKGWNILASTRSEDTAAEIQAAGYEPVLADPQTPDGQARLRAALQRSEAILGCAPPAETGDPFLPILKDMNLDGVWLGYLSTTGVYGDRQGGWAFEWQAPTPGQARSVRRAKAEADWLVLKARVFRLAGIYGPGRSAFDRLERSPTIMDKPGHVFGRIHVSDIAQAVWLSLNNPQATGVFNLADDWPDTQAHVMAGAAQIAGRPAPKIIVYDPASLTPMQASFYAECRRVSNARAKAVLGWTLQYPSWREGLAAIWGDVRS